MVKKAMAFMLSLIMIASVVSSALAGLPDGLGIAGRNSVKTTEKAVPEFGRGDVASRKDKGVKVATNNMSSKANGKLIGYICDGAPFEGWIEVDVNNPDTYNLLSLVNLEEAFIYAAEYNAENGETYAFWYDINNDKVFGKADVETGAIEAMSAVPSHITGLAMDYTSHTLYAMSPGNSGEVKSIIYSVNMENGEFTNLGYVTGTTDRLIVMAISTSGIMYAIDFAGYLYEIDKDTLEAVTVGNTGLDVMRAQSLTYDHDAGVLYWAHCSLLEADLYVVNPFTAEVTYLGEGSSSMITGLHARPSVAPSPQPIPVEGVLLSHDVLDLVDGASVRINATLLPEGGYFLERGVTYSSDNDAIVSVSHNGVVTAEGEGTATITVTTVDGGYTDTCSVNVRSAADEYSEVSDAINKEGSAGYYIFATGNDGNYPFEVATKDGRECVVSTNQGIHNSSATIQLYKPHRFIGGTKIKFDWKTSSELGYDYGKFYLNDTEIRSISGTDDNWVTVEYEIPASGDYVMRWEYIKDSMYSEADDSLWIDNLEIITTVGVELEDIEVTPERLATIVGATAQLHVKYTPINAENTNVTYSSNNEDVVTVSSTGLMHGIGVGTAVITIVSEANPLLTDTVFVDVSMPRPVDELPVHPVVPGNEYPFDLNGTGDSRIISLEERDRYGYLFSIDMAYGDGVILKVSPDMTAFIEDTIMYIYDEKFELIGKFDDSGEENLYPEAKFIPESGGTYYILVTTYLNYVEEQGLAVLTVTDYTPIPIESITVSPSSMVIGVNRAGTAVANILPENTDFPAIVWTTSNAAVATVDSNGTIRGVSKGTATITVTAVFGGSSGTCTVTVVDEPELPDYDGNIYAYNMYDPINEMPMGFVSYNTEDSPDEIELVKEISLELLGAAYYNGLIYGYEFIDYGFFYVLNYVTIDATTFTVIESVDVTSADMLARDMTYDYTEGIMYALATDVVSNISFLAKVDLNTGVFETVGELMLKDGAQMLTIACTTTGELYGIGTDSLYYGISRDSAAVDVIAQMPYGAIYVQTMTYNYYDNNMYWFQLNASEANLVVFDAETGDIKSVGAVGSGYMEFCGAFVYANPDTFPGVGDLISVDGVVIIPEDISVNVGQTYKLRAKISPINATNKKVTWHSNNPAVATVDESGTVNAIHGGTAIITATTEDGGFTASATVTVNIVTSDLAAGKARVTLTASDIWGDGTGYQMLLDANATAYGTIIPVDGALGTTNISNEIYSQFEQKIPENADGALTTSNIVFNESVTIDIPAGVYDWCITNPTPSDAMYIANNGRANDFEFEEGVSYQFTIELVGMYDRVVATQEYIGVVDPDPRPYYNVTFIDYDDSLYAAYIVKSGGDAVLPSEPTRAHWLFREWTGGEHTNVTENRTLKAFYYMRGDANMDANVNTGDAALILMSVIDSNTLVDEFAVRLADINESGEHNTGDAAMVLQIVVGLLPEPW